MTLNYVEHFFILASVVTGCVSISTIASLNGVPVGVLGISWEFCSNNKSLCNTT